MNNDTIQISVKTKTTQDKANFLINTIATLARWLDYSDYIVTFSVVLVLDELLRNAIKHGNYFDKEKFITLNATLTKSKYELEITDEGKGFDFDNFVKRKELTDKKSPSGRGIYLVKCYVDKLIYSNGGRTVKISVGI